MARTVFITGVSSGLGLGLVKAYLFDKHHVFGISRRRPRELDGVPGFSFLSVDLAKAETIPSAVETLLTGVNTLDTVILNAGILGAIGDLGATPVDALKHVMDVNVWANKILIDALFQAGKKIDQVVAISSGAAVSGSRGWNGYGISKAALNMLIRLYAAERTETHFSALAPGLIDTGMQEAVRAMPSDPRYPTLDRLKQAHGTPDMPTPDAIAPRLMHAIRHLRERKSGDFVDIRSL